MDYKVIYSDLAIETLDKNMSYLKNNWSTKSAVNFLDKVEKTISLIGDNSHFFSLWRETNKRKAVTVKQITMFYEVKKETINILLFWNNYQNTDSIKALIK